MTDVAARLKDDLAASASETIAGAVEGLTRGAEAQKTASAAAIAGFARSVRSSADELAEQSPQMARVVRASAETVERFSTDLQSKSVNELLDAATSFARKRPYVFLGLGVLAGLVLARAFDDRR